MMVSTFMTQPTLAYPYQGASEQAIKSIETALRSKADTDTCTHLCPMQCRCRDTQRIRFAKRKDFARRDGWRRPAHPSDPPTRQGRPVIRRSGAGAARLAARQQPQPQRIQPDEALGILLVVGAGIVLEGDMRLGIEALRRLPADDGRRALVELHADGARS